MVDVQPDEPRSDAEAVGSGAPAVPNWVGTSDVDVYADAISVVVGVYGVTLSFGLRELGAQPAKELVRVRLSPEMADVMRRIFDQLLDSYVVQYGPVNVPQALLQSLGVSDEDLQRVHADAEAKKREV